MTIAKLWYELRYHATKRPIKINIKCQTLFQPWKIEAVKRRVQVRRDGDDGWTVRIIARPGECEAIERLIDSLPMCVAHYGNRINPKYKRLICSIASLQANEKERQMMDNASKGIW